MKHKRQKPDFVPTWGRPARPIICRMSASLYSSQEPATYCTVDLITTRWAGRFTPIARVRVVTGTSNTTGNSLQRHHQLLTPLSYSGELAKLIVFDKQIVQQKLKKLYKILKQDNKGFLKMDLIQIQHKIFNLTISVIWTLLKPLSKSIRKPETVSGTLEANN